MKKLIPSAALAIGAAILLSACSGEDYNSTPYTAGKISDSVYTSEFFGMTASFGDVWELKAAEERSGSALIEAMENNGYITDLSAFNPETSASVTIFVSLSSRNKQNYTEEESMNSLLNAMRDEYSSGSYDLTHSSVNSLIFAGENHYSVDLAILHVGMDSLSYKRIVSVVQGDYVASVNISSPDMDELEKITESFLAVS